MFRKNCKELAPFSKIAANDSRQISKVGMKYLLITTIHLGCIDRSQQVREVHLPILHVKSQPYGFVKFLDQNILFDLIMIVQVYSVDGVAEWT